MLTKAIGALAVFAILAGLLLLMADSDSMQAFLISKVIGGVVCLVGLVALAHIDNIGGENG